MTIPDSGQLRRVGELQKAADLLIITLWKAKKKVKLIVTEEKGLCGYVQACMCACTSVSVCERV